MIPKRIMPAIDTRHRFMMGMVMTGEMMTMKNRFRPHEITPVATILFRQGGEAGGKLKDQET